MCFAEVWEAIYRDNIALSARLALRYLAYCCGVVAFINICRYVGSAGNGIETKSVQRHLDSTVLVDAVEERESYEMTAMVNGRMLSEKRQKWHLSYVT